MKIVKIILALLLLICLADLPYGYYVLIRFVAMIVFGIMYIRSKEDGRDIRYLWVALALLFQPFFKIPLGRTLWNIIDVICAILLAYSVTTENK